MASVVFLRAVNVGTANRCRPAAIAKELAVFGVINIGAVGTFVNLPPGARTTTIESKTNFLGAALGARILGESTPVHRGRTTMVWQTRITLETGKLVALVIQTQMVLPG